MTAALVAAGVLLPGAGPATAHVEVSVPSARQGSHATVTFAVVSESIQASTTAVKILLPTDPALQDVTVLPVAGWTAASAPSGGTTPSEVTWTADDPVTALAPGNYAQFQLQATLPRVREVIFQVVQTYSDGEVVRWDQPRAPGGAAPEKPAPVLPLFTDAELQAAARPVAEPAAGGTATTAWLVAAVLVAIAIAMALVVVRRVSRTRRGHGEPAGRLRHRDVEGDGLADHHVYPGSRR